MKTKDLINEVLALPLEEKVQVVDSILRSMNPVEVENEKKWMLKAKERLAELRTGKTGGIPGDEVFNKIWKRYS